MKKSLALLGSTGSVGSSTLKAIENQNFKIMLLTTKKNLKKCLKQAIMHNVKDVIVEDKNQFDKYQNLFNAKKIRLHLGLKNIKKIFKKKINYCINSISGIEGLEPTLNIIPYTEKILLANKESIICGWHLIQKKLKINKTKFIPIDSEHFSIWKLIHNDNYSNINKIILTASGGPFLYKLKKKIINVEPKIALKHPNWKMGKKISIDSSNMMNKIFEYIEAIKIFNLKKKKISILIHPSSFVHAIIFYNGGLIKFLAHETNMKIPILNALDVLNLKEKNIISKNLRNLNNLKFIAPNKKKFPLLEILSFIPNKVSYFETILITLNDLLVKKYLNKQINYISIQKNLLGLIKSPYLYKFYKLKPKNIYDIKKMINKTEIYLEKNIKLYDN